MIIYPTLIFPMKPKNIYVTTMIYPELAHLHSPFIRMPHLKKEGFNYIEWQIFWSKLNARLRKRSSLRKSDASWAFYGRTQLTKKLSLSKFSMS